jgi:ABC-2 type transport system permease protein
MRNMLTVFRRDFFAFFTSPIGYIFMIVFLLISVGLYITSFFTFPVADMRSFFSNLPILLCVFIPAVTMRIWAEERKENTWEMLLTFPMKARELVLGKFLAVLAFFALTLAATVTVPIMLARLGNPDGGAIFGGYFGTLLLGAFFLSIGIFISGLCKDQIVAFVVTLLVCFAIFLVGTNFIASYIDGVAPGLGSRLSQYLGFLDHYNSFVRGVVEMADVVYFLAWTAIFLGLNMMFIEGRHRPKAKVTFAGAIALCLVIGLLFNGLVYGQSLGRFDLTEGNIYTVSKASTEILGELKNPVQVTYYVTPKGKMPTALKTLEQDVIDKLDELEIASDGKMKVKVIHLEAANMLAEREDTFALDDEEGEEAKKDEKEVIEKRLLDKGIQPFPVQAIDDDQVTSLLVYSSIGVGYGSKPEEIITPVAPQTLPELEYRLVSTIHKLAREKQPIIAMVAPEEDLNIPPEMRQIYMQMGQPLPQTEDPYQLVQRWLEEEKYEVRRVKLTKESPLPDEFDALLILDPRGFNDRQRYELNRVLVSGKPVILAVQNYRWQYTPTQSGTRVVKEDMNPGVNELLEQYGLAVSKDVLMDENSFPLTIQSGSDPLSQLLGLGQSLQPPTHIKLDGANMNPDTAITSRLETVLYLWGTALELKEEELKKHGLTSTVLMHTSDRAWTVPADLAVHRTYYDAPESGLRRFPVMAMVTGQFPDVYKDKPRPAWPTTPPQPGMPPEPPAEDTEAEATPVTPAPGKLLLLGASEMFRKNFLQVGSDLDLILNSVDAVSLDERLVHVRGMKPVDRTISKPAAGTRTFWKFVNYALGSIIIAAVGITIATVRRKRRNAYTLAYAGDAA